MPKLMNGYFTKNLLLSSSIRINLDCLQCDGKGKFMNEFGLMEKCTFCKNPDLNFS